MYIFEISIQIEKITIQKQEVNDIKCSTNDKILKIYNKG